MLAEMRIRGLGVIDDATLELDPGLTVLTGETGAGKTMVVTGLTLLGGGRAEASRVSSDATRAIVEGVFQADADALALAEEVGADADDDGSLIASRTLSADGRSRAHLGGRSVPAGVLARLAERSLAVHGQNDQLALLRPAEQRALLDRFAGRRSPARCSSTARSARSGCGSAPSSPSAATTPAGSPRRPTCCGTASPRSRRSTRSPARTTSSSHWPAGSPPRTTCAPPRRPPGPRWSAPMTATPRRPDRSRWSATPGTAWPPPTTRSSPRSTPGWARCWRCSATSAPS
jgi:hypothetical protein